MRHVAGYATGGLAGSDQQPQPLGCFASFGSVNLFWLVAARMGNFRVLLFCLSSLLIVGWAQVPYCNTDGRIQTHETVVDSMDLYDFSVIQVPPDKKVRQTNFFFFFFFFTIFTLIFCFGN